MPDRELVDDAAAEAEADAPSLPVGSGAPFSHSAAATKSSRILAPSTC